MNLFKLEYIDKNGNPTDIEGKGTHEFKHRIIAPLVLAIILPPLLIITGISRLFNR